MSNWLERTEIVGKMGCALVGLVFWLVVLAALLVLAGAFVWMLVS